MSLILGLDVSTSVVGICIVNSTIERIDGKHIVLLDAIDLKKCKNLWEKADKVEDTLRSTRELKCSMVDRVVLEEPLMGFRPGMSSAATISTLMRFNGVVSYIARDVFASDPEYVSASHARKLCGVKLQRTSVAGKNGKDQVFEHMMNNDLKHVVWPLKKSGKIVEWAKDACDAYVVAQSAMIIGPIEIQPKKPKK